MGASGNRLREQLQRFETLEQEIQFTRVCEHATFGRRVSIGMCYKTIPDVDDGFGDRTSACREYTPLAKVLIPEYMQELQDKLQVDQFFKFISHDILTSAELQFRFFPQQRKTKPPGW